jgi:hypothetical protein
MDESSQMWPIVAVVAGMLENTIELCEPHPKSIGFLRPEAV